MCGIIGYTGPLEAKTILLGGLSSLEYRGYDSAGIALFQSQTLTSHTVELIKTTGKVSLLKKLCDSTPLLPSGCGIGHTRWATHGGVTTENSHPHQVGRVTLVHNGIIENYKSLAETWNFSEQLRSETDTEIAACLINQFYENDPLQAIRKALPYFEGSYAFCILFSDHPGEIYAVRKVSPLVAAYTPSGSLAASDLTALLPYTKQYFVLPEQSIAKLTPYRITIFDENGDKIQPELLTVNWSMDAAMKNGFPHFMLKEIHEQPQALRNTILPRIVDELPNFDSDQIPDSTFVHVNKIQIVACGTAMYAGMVSKSLFESMLKIPVTVSIASEFRYEDPLIDENTLVIIISQSGETIDTLAALRLAKEKGSVTLSIVNVKGSTIARESDYVFYTHAGPEIAVASTKAYSVQLAALYLIVCRMALACGKMTLEDGKHFLQELLCAIPAIDMVLTKKEEIRRVVSHLTSADNAFFIGRGRDYAFSLEGALKLKEISYIHAEAYAAGELKHGTIALITDQVPVIAIATQEAVYTKMISNIREVKARGAFVILITKESAGVEEGIADIHMTIPNLDDSFTVFPIAVILQLIAYYTSVKKGLNVDQPRNLAKSVTVE